MKYLVYMSSESVPMDDGDLLDILTKSRANNVKAGLTGMLLYGDGAFIQVLEGDEDEVDAMFETIKADGRHKNVIEITKGELHRRNFADWAMGFKTINLDIIKEFSGYIDLRNNKHFVEDETHPAIVVMKTFANASEIL